MSDIAEIGAVYEYHRTGEAEYLAKHIESGGTISDSTRQVIADALRGITPRKRSKAQRDAEIVSSMRFLISGRWDGNQYTIEQAREIVASAFYLSGDAIKKVWDARPG